MNYKKHYENLVNRSPRLHWEGEKHHCLSWKEKDGFYREGHRIIPGCMGGKYVSENVAYLTPEEHFVAHELLVKIYPKTLKLIYALNMLSDKKINNKMFGWLRKKWLKALKNDEDRNRKISENTKGLMKSEEHRKNLSLALSGKKKSVEHRKKVSETTIGRKLSDNHRKNIGLHSSKTMWTNNGIINKKILKTDKISEGFIIGRKPYKHYNPRKTENKPCKEETKKKISVAQLGSKNHAYGKIHITNGVKNTLHPKNEPLPEGFRKGRVILR